MVVNFRISNKTPYILLHLLNGHTILIQKHVAHPTYLNPVISKLFHIFLKLTVDLTVNNFFRITATHLTFCEEILRYCTYFI